MADRLSIDSSFLIALQREERRGGGAAHIFLEQRLGSILCVSAVALGEFAEGFQDASDQRLQAIVAGLEVLDIDRATAMQYAGISRDLRQAGRLIGTNDLWIGCSSLRHGLPLVTRDVSHFRRIEGLLVLSY